MVSPDSCISPPFAPPRCHFRLPILISPLLQYCEAERAAVPNPVSSPARASIRFASVGPRGLGSEVDRVFSAGDGVLVPTVQLGFVSPC